MSKTDDRLEAFEEQLGIRPGFLKGVYDSESDWSFIIKSHALLEAAVTHLIVSTISRPELGEFVARLEMSGAKTGKLAITEVLHLTNSRQRRFIRALSELRNDLVHDIKNVDFNLRDFVIDKLQHSQKKKDVLLTYALFIDEDETLTFVVQGKRVDLVQRFRDEPRWFFWFSIKYFLSITYLTHYGDFKFRRHLSLADLGRPE